MEPRKATAIAPSNIAFVKYMGKKKVREPDDQNLADNDSVSMCTDGMLTTTTVEFGDYEADSVVINGEQEEGDSSRAIEQLDRIRAIAGITRRAKVASMNNFPTGTGNSSSASGLAALSLAGAAAAGLHLSERKLSILARRGSGSASRSIPGGFVRWYAGDRSEESYAETILPADHWDIADVVAVVSTARKTVSTTATHAKVTETPYYAARLASVGPKIDACISLLRAKNFDGLGQLVEREALELHALFLAAGVLHLHSRAVELMHQAPLWRAEGLPVYYTVNTGQDVHLLCLQRDVDQVRSKLESIGVPRVIVNKPAPGARLIEEHLF